MLKIYIEKVKELLACNNTLEEYVQYTYTNEEIDVNYVYFTRCMEEGLSPYKALLFFEFWRK